MIFSKKGNLTFSLLGNLTDSCKSLWGSWSIVGEHNKVFFAGDTGYCPAFKEIGNKFGPFDVGLIPIGAYCPRWFMKSFFFCLFSFSFQFCLYFLLYRPQHVNPKEAVKIHLDLQCKLSIGMHWGTFVL